MAVGPSQRPATKATRSPTKALKSEGINNLIGAAENGDLASIRLLLEQGVRVTSANRVRAPSYTCSARPVHALLLSTARSSPRPNLALPLYPALSICSCSPDSTRLAEAHRAPHDTQPRLPYTASIYRTTPARLCVQSSALLLYTICAHLTPTPPQLSQLTPAPLLTTRPLLRTCSGHTGWRDGAHGGG